MDMAILKRERCMLLGAELQKDFRGEVIATTVYLINICPSTRIGFKMPIEVWSGN